LALVAGAAAALACVSTPHVEGFAEDASTGDTGPPSTFSRGPGTVPSPCTNLQCQQHSCLDGHTTSISGVVYDPAGKNPLYDVAVYVPNAPLSPIVHGATCDACGATPSGDPLVTTLTDAQGRFTLKNAPDGDNIPLVMQIGKWRRQVSIRRVTACTDTVVADTSLTRLPRSSAEGDMPYIALSTGGCDALECLLRKVGIADSEFTSVDDSGGHVHIYRGSGEYSSEAGYIVGGSPASGDALWDSTPHLSKYDVVMLSCECDEHMETKPASALAAMQAYANAGGRIFASHFHYTWFDYGPPPWPSTATWYPGSNELYTIAGVVDETFPKGRSFYHWLASVRALNVDGSLTIQQAKDNALVTPAAGAAGTQQWIFDANPYATEYLTFNAPYGADPSAQCGRVVFSDLHVSAGSPDAPGYAFPVGCISTELSPQEKALEFMLFDLTACVAPDNQPPQPPPTK